MENSQKRPHYGALDTLRGLCVISMVLYHAMYDLVYLKGFPAPWYGDWPGYLWQQSICWTFILLSGLCWNLSRRHLRRGLLFVGCGAVITLATWLAMPSQLILYGVLNLLGLSALLLIPLDKALRKLPPWLGLAGAGLLFFLTRGVPRGYLGFEGLRLWDLPAALYQWDALAVLGFHSPRLFLHRLLPPVALVFPVPGRVFPVEGANPPQEGAGAAPAGAAAPQLRGQAQPAHLPGPPAPADGPLLVPLKKFARAFARASLFFRGFSRALLCLRKICSTMRHSKLEEAAAWRTSI